MTMKTMTAVMVSQSQAARRVRTMTRQPLLLPRAAVVRPGARLQEPVLVVVVRPRALRGHLVAAHRVVTTELAYSH